MTTNFERAFEDHPDVYAAWRALNGSIKARMDERRYELATLAAAQALGSSYCSLAHGKILAEQFGEPVEAIVRDRRSAGLSDLDVAVMDLAELVARRPGSLTDADFQPVYDLGLSPADAMDVVLAASARCFFSTALDALRVLPDASYAQLDPGLLDVLVVGRPIAASDPGVTVS
jgi:alkylhydroperoxidase family enzyme